MKKAAIAILAVLIAGFGAYLYFSGKEYVVRIPESDLQAKLEEKLPLTKTYLLFFELTLENPRIRLQNGSKRVKANRGRS